jgi:hypothetical protein
MPQPSYSPTDVGAAVVVLVGIALDVLTGYGVIPALDAQTRTALMASLTVLTVAAIAAYIRNRSVKTQAAATVAVAQAAASAVQAPAAPVSEGVKPAESGYVLTPPEHAPPTS